MRTYFLRAVLILCVVSLIAALTGLGSGAAMVALLFVPLSWFLVVPWIRGRAPVSVAAGRSRPPSSRAPPTA